MFDVILQLAGVLPALVVQKLAVALAVVELIGLAPLVVECPINQLQSPECRRPFAVGLRFVLSHPLRWRIISAIQVTGAIFVIQIMRSRRENCRESVNEQFNALKADPNYRGRGSIVNQTKEKESNAIDQSINQSTKRRRALNQKTRSIESLSCVEH